MKSFGDSFNYEGIKLFRAVDSDIKPLVALINEAYSYQDVAKTEPRANESKLRARIAETEFFVAKNAKNIVGCVYIEKQGASLHFGLLTVSTQQRGSGLAPAIINAVEKHAFDLKLSSVQLNYMSLAPWLKKYYEKYGYRETGQIEEWGTINLVRMSKQLVSPNYRNDDENGLDSSVISYLGENYLPKLKNKADSNPKLLVVFSGGNALGKSTLARKIGEELGGLVLENDEIKHYIREMHPKIEREKLNIMTWQYSLWLYNHLDDIARNSFIVRDGVIDWYYDRIFPIFEKNGYPIFIIAYDVSLEKATELIRKRGDTPTVSVERQLILLKDHEIHTKRFRKIYTPDITLTDETVFEHEQVLKKLRQRIISLG